MKIENKYIVRSLLLLVALEAIVITMLVAARLHVVVEQTPLSENDFYNPLQIALEYDSSDEKFKELLTQFPEFVNQHSKNTGSLGSPILADCALLQKTNYIRILLTHGADIELAIESLRDIDAQEAIELLRQVANGKEKSE